MADKRKGERREPEKGVIIVKKRDAIMFGILFIVLIISIVACVNYVKVKKDYDSLKDSYNNNLTDKEIVNNENSSNTDNNFACNISIEGDKYSVLKGEKIEYEVKVSDIQGDGIVAFEALIDYDLDVFECTFEENISGHWNKISMIDNYMTITRSDLMPSSEDQVIGKIVLIAKSDAKEGKSDVNLTKIRLTSGDDKTFTAKDKNIVVEVMENDY